MQFSSLARLLATVIGVVEITNVVIASVVFASKCPDGIIIGSDGLIGTGIFVSSRSSKKIARLNRNSVVACAGGETDFFRLCEDLEGQCSAHALFSQCEMGTKSIARLARALIYSKYHHAHIIIAGCEDFVSDDNMNDWSIHEILPGGSHLDVLDRTVAGSGSSLASSYLMDLASTAAISLEESIEIAKKVLNMVISFDHKSGGSVQLYRFTRVQGLARLSPA